MSNPRHAVAAPLCLISALWLATSAAGATEGRSPWRWQKTLTPLALVADGLWWEGFRVDEALDRSGFRRRDDWKDLSLYTIVILVNVPAVRFPPESLAQLREFVNQGGGLVVLGGLCAYENGRYAGTPLEEVLPVSLKESYCGHLFPSAEKGARLTLAAQADWPLQVDFGAGPTAYYFHKLIPKSNARVQVMVGDLPALVSGTFGKGRVVACALAVNGDPAPGVLPFWEWKDWPAVLAQALDWAGGARPTGTDAAPNRTATLEPLTDDELQSLELDMTIPPKDLLARAAAHPNERTAAVLFDLAVPENGEPKCTLDSVLAAILPYAKPEWDARLKAVADELNPNIEVRKAALILLGASHGPSAYAVLTKALGDKRAELAAIDGLGRLGMQEAVPLLRRRFEEALAPARLPDGPDRWKPAELATASLPAAHAAIALYRLGDPDAVPRLCTFAANLNLYRRIVWNATKRWPRDPQGQKILKGILEQARLLQEAWDFLVANAGPILPSQGDAFVKYAATASDPVVIELLARAIEQSVGRLPKADWHALSRAKSGILARMAKAVTTQSE